MNQAAQAEVIIPAWEVHPQVNPLQPHRFPKNTPNILQHAATHYNTVPHSATHHQMKGTIPA